MKKFFRNNGLSLTLLLLFALCLMGQSIAGYYKNIEDQKIHGEEPQPWNEYLVSSGLWEAVFENWESEFLEMSAYVFLTAYLFQRGSAASKDPDGKGSDGTHSKWLLSV